MGANLETARNELITRCTTAWREQAVIVGVQVMPDIVVGFFDNDGIPNEVRSAGTRGWARLTVQHTDSNRPLSARRVTRMGLISLQIFLQRKSSDIDAKAQRLAAAVAVAIEAQRGNVDLFGVTPVERPVNNGYAQCDVAARFSYTEHLR